MARFRAAVIQVFPLSFEYPISTPAIPVLSEALQITLTDAPGTTELDERGEVMVTVGALVSDWVEVGAGVGVGVIMGVEVGAGVEEPEAWIVNAFKQTFEFGYIEVRSVQSVPLVLT